MKSWTICLVSGKIVSLFGICKLKINKLLFPVKKQTMKTINLLYYAGVRSEATNKACVSIF